MFCLPFQALAAPAVAAAALTPAEIQATFATGKPFSSSTPSGTTYTMVLKADGTASRTLSKDGYCSIWGKSAENCYRVERDSARYKVIDRSRSTVAYWMTQ